MIVVVNREYRYVLANKAFLNYRGMNQQQIVGKLIVDVLDPKLFEGVVKEKLDECFGGKVVSYELQYQYPELGTRDLSIAYVPVEGPTGIDRVACVLQDVTDRKRSEEALRTSEREQHKIAEQLETERARLIEAQAVARVGSWRLRSKRARLPRSNTGSSWQTAASKSWRSAGRFFRTDKGGRRA